MQLSAIEIFGQNLVQFFKKEKNYPSLLSFVVFLSFIHLSQTTSALNFEATIVVMEVWISPDLIEMKNRERKFFFQKIKPKFVEKFIFWWKGSNCNQLKKLRPSNWKKFLKNSKKQIHKKWGIIRQLTLNFLEWSLNESLQFVVFWRGVGLIILYIYNIYWNRLTFFTWIFLHRDDCK